MKHNPELKSDLLSRASLIAWLATKPADEYYQYANCNRCLLGQWVKTIDPAAEPRSWFVYSVNGQIVDLGHFESIARGEGWWDWTFGAALKRALAEP